jgi:hypothetical protein
MRTPFSVLPDEPDASFDDRYGGAVILDDTNQFPDTMAGGVSPHIPLVMLGVILIGLKYLSDTNFITTNTNTFWLSAMDVLGDTLKVSFGIVVGKLAVTKLAAVAPDFPGVKDAVFLTSYI